MADITVPGSDGMHCNISTCNKFTSDRTELDEYCSNPHSFNNTNS